VHEGGCSAHASLVTNSLKANLNAKIRGEKIRNALIKRTLFCPAGARR
jgi:hypothetical protein